ncbi:MAG: 6-bladed beta-propeller [Tannerella sp.]|nr:6-bladed beta-propeller [Tannerella sp.]
MKIPFLPLFLVLLGVLSCTHRQKEIHTFEDHSVSGRLSDISDEIIAIPLETTSECKINNIRQVQCDQADIFILNNNEICHFDRSGRFINKILTGNDSSIQNYTVNSDAGQLIILDSLQQLHYYSYNGNKLHQKDIRHTDLWRTLYNVVYHGQSLWAIAENLTENNCLEKRLYKFDTEFNLQEAVKLCNVDLGRFYLEGNFTPELSVIDGMICVYSPSSYKETVLEDTLYLVAHNSLTYHPAAELIAESRPVYYQMPVRIHRRFMVSSYRHNCSEAENYLFCYDRKENKAYGCGFADDFYRTGLVKDLQALDVHNNQFYFCKSGEALSASFPERTENDNPVLFFVTLKS